MDSLSSAEEEEQGFSLSHFCSGHPPVLSWTHWVRNGTSSNLFWIETGVGGSSALVNHPGQEIARFSVFRLLPIDAEDKTLHQKLFNVWTHPNQVTTSKPSPGTSSLPLSWGWGRTCGLGTAVLGSGVISVGMVKLEGWGSSLS